MVSLINKFIIRPPIGWIFGFALMVKFILALAIPITGDEAYWVFWGRELRWGYYCHPPMVGWVLYFLMKISDSLLLLRSPAILGTIFIAALIYKLLRDADKPKAKIFTAIFLLSPLNLLFVFVSTDMLVVFFLFLAAVSLLRSQQKKNAYFFCFLSGVFLGLAALSKYFAFLLAFAFLVYYFFLTVTRQESPARVVNKLLLTGLGFLPLLLPNVIWNYYNGWPNIMFNVYNRNVGMSFSVTHALIFLAVNVYLMTPYVAALFFKSAKYVIRNGAGGNFQPIYFCYFIPIIIFFALSFFRPIGLHWPLAFYTIFFLMLSDVFQHLKGERLTGIVKSVVYFSMVHLGVIGVLLGGKGIILNKFEFIKPKQMATLAMVVYPQEIVKIFHDKAIENGKFYLATESYSSASLLSYFLKQEVTVFGKGTHHGRQHDMTTDFRRFDGKNILIFRRGELSEEKIAYYRQFFKKVTVRVKKLRNAEYPIVLGYHFNYAAYAEKVLCEIKKTYYNIPRYLPYKQTFMDKYHLACD